MSRTLTRNNVLVFTETLQSAAAATGNGTAVECLGFGALTAQVTGTFSGTVTFEGTVDGTNYIAIRGMNKNTGTSASTATAAGIFQFSVAGLKYFRARVSAYSSGLITVTATISPESEPALPAASTTAATVAIDQTTSGTTNKVVSTGAAAHDAAASGNPVQVGGVYRSTDPVLTDGDVGSVRLNAKGEPIVQLSGSNVEQTLNAALPTKANLIGISDGSKIQAMQGNISGTLLASAARTASATSPQIVNQNARGVQICLNITVASGTGGLITRAYGVDPLSGGIFIVNADPTAITATGTYVYEIYPGSSTGGVGGASKVSQRTAAVIPSKFYAFISHGDGSSYTYSVGYSLII